MRWLAGAFDPTEFAGEDIVLHEVRDRLAADEKLAKIFRPDRIYVQGLLSPADIHLLPELVIAAAVSQTELRPATERIIARIFLVVRFSWPAREPEKAGEAGIATLMAHLKTVLLQPKNRLLVVKAPDGREYSLAKISNPGTINHQASPLDHSNPSGVLFAAILDWNYTLDLNPDTGRIRNSELAGA